MLNCKMPVVSIFSGIKVIQFLVITLFVGVAKGQDSSIPHPPKYKIWLNTQNNTLVKGILINTTDSSVYIFPGKFSKWQTVNNLNLIGRPYSDINLIKLR